MGATKRSRTSRAKLVCKGCGLILMKLSAGAKGWVGKDVFVSCRKCGSREMEVVTRDAEAKKDSAD